MENIPKIDNANFTPISTKYLLMYRIEPINRNAITNIIIRLLAKMYLQIFSKYCFAMVPIRKNIKN